MAISVAILEIFSVEEWRDLEIWIWSLSRSLKRIRGFCGDALYKLMIDIDIEDRPRDFLLVTIVNIALSCTIFEFFDVE